MTCLCDFPRSRQDKTCHWNPLCFYWCAHDLNYDRFKYVGYIPLKIGLWGISSPFLLLLGVSKGSDRHDLAVQKNTSCYLVLIVRCAEQPNQTTILQKLSVSRQDIARKFALILSKSHPKTSQIIAILCI